MSLFGDNGRFNPKRARSFMLVGNGTYTAWTVPKYASFLMITGADGGGGGGAGFSGGAGAGGGGGGGCASTYGIIIPTMTIPSVLYLQAGLGGAGGTTGTGSNGTPTIVTTVAVSPPGPQDAILFLGSTAAHGGSVGTSAVGGAGGQNSAPDQNSFYAFNGSLWGTAGVTGGQGGSPSGSPANVTTALQKPVCQGGGGGGANNATASNGSSIALTSGYFSSVVGGLAGTTGNGGTGANGETYFSPFVALSGAGGGGAQTTNVAVGGAGGNGGYGCGGGGGGGGQTGGAGGNGGPGFLLVSWW